MRPDIQIISRATLDRNVQTLHRAGADFVLSYASMGAHAIFNLLRRSNILLLAEGLDVFRVDVPPGLAGKPLVETGIRENTRCSVIAIEEGGEVDVNPGPAAVLPADGKIILIGTVESEEQFLRRYVNR